MDGQNGRKIAIEVIGLKELSCSPFPCDDTRSCGLETCYPSGKLNKAVDALRAVLAERYGNRITLELTLIDSEMPDHVRELLHARSPPLPVVLIDGKLMPFGRISLPQISDALDCLLEEADGPAP